MIRLILSICFAIHAVAVVAEVDFERDVAPILQTHCVDCHSAEDTNGNLQLDNSLALDAETDSGKPAIIPGHANKSELISRIETTDDDDRMPPDGERLNASEIQTLRSWINSGAEWSHTQPPSSDIDPEVTHWSFQPIRSPAVPTVKESDWAWNDIDRFLQSRREKSGLTPAGDADAIAILRRATYDLTGLPPTIAESQRFKQQVQSVGLRAATSALIDDLLSRESYGERWGRHWMDWVRYADTAGDNSDYPIPQAYLYRNYIIDSLNNDLPYDQFLSEQIAGDLMPAESQDERNRKTIATGYLAMARRFGSLVERYPWHLTIEDTIDNVGRTMMGLTLSCARCHDHKFDPISTRDYYGMYGIFASTRYPFPGLELFKAQRDFVSLLDREQTDAILAAHRPKTNELIQKLDQLMDQCESKALENAAREKDSTVAEKRKMQDELDAMLIKARKAGEKLADHLKSLPEIPTAYAVADGKMVNASIQIKGEPTRPGAVVPRGFPKVLGGQRLDNEKANSTSGRLELASWITHRDNPLTARVIVNRVWQRHFGTGIVSSTSDFGLRGEHPSHPDLLDYLATDLINHGWSLKLLHRRIMTSRAYAMASDGAIENNKRDPNNRLLWRFNRQRLDAESIRDSLLVFAGTLDPTPQTDPFPFPPRDKWTFTQHHPFKADYPSNKRSVYLMTKRLTTTPYFQTFDGPDPNVCTSRRDQSITALQALYFVNDDFLHEQSKQFAKQLIQHTADVDLRIDLATQTILSRKSSQDERQLMRNHLQAVKKNDAESSELAAWSSLTRSLLRLNEFLYLD